MKVLMVTLFLLSSAHTYANGAASNYEDTTIFEIIYTKKLKIVATVKVEGIFIPAGHRFVRINFTGDSTCSLALKDSGPDRVLIQDRSIQFTWLHAGSLVANDTSIEKLLVEITKETTLSDLKTDCATEKLEFKVLPHNYSDYKAASLNNDYKTI